jgi:Tol biopolymer transport system component
MSVQNLRRFARFAFCATLAIGASNIPAASLQRVDALSLTDATLRPVVSPNANSLSGAPGAAVSEDGRFVAFAALASNLVSGLDDANGVDDVYLLDRDSGDIVPVSVRGGEPARTANGRSRMIAVSRSGSHVLFASLATDLVVGQIDTNLAEDLFVFDRVLGTTRLVSHRLSTAATAGNGASTDGHISADGRRIVFRSGATDLVAATTDSNGVDDTFRFDSDFGSVQLVSESAVTGGRTANGATIPTDLSSDGVHIVLLSAATDLIAGQLAGVGDQVFVSSLGGARRLVSHVAANLLRAGNNLSTTRPRISADGAFIVYASRATDLVAGVTDTASSLDVFVYDRVAQSNQLLTRSAVDSTRTANGAASGQVWISADGERIAFSTQATDMIVGITDANATLQDIYLQERESGARTLVSHRGTDASVTGAARSSTVIGFSDSGKQVLYASNAPDLVADQIDQPDNSHLFLFSLGDNASALVTHRRDSNVAAANQLVALGALSADGQVAVFGSGASDLSAGDDNGRSDVFSWQDGLVTQHSFAAADIENTQTARGPSQVRTRGIDDSGRYVVLQTSATDLASFVIDSGFSSDLYLVDRLDRSAQLITRTAADPRLPSAGTIGQTIALGRGEPHVVFSSDATDLVAGVSGIGGNAQLYRWSQNTEEVRLISHAAGAPLTAGNGAVSGQPAISDDGRFIAYLSRATNLVAGQTGPVAENLFLYDTLTGTTTLVNHAAGNPALSSGAALPGFAMTADGARIAFATATSDVADVPDVNGNPDVFVHERATGTNTLVSRSAAAAGTAGNGSLDPDIANDGTVVFRSAARDLIAGVTQAGNSTDIFLWRADSGVQLITPMHNDPALPPIESSGAPQISDDARRVLFPSRATTLLAGFASAHAGDNLFAYDTATDTLTLVSHTPGNGAQAASDFVITPVLARGGSHAAFYSKATNLIDGQIDSGAGFDMFLADLQSGEVRLASHTVDSSSTAGRGDPTSLFTAPSISADGQLVAFSSTSSDLVRHDVNGTADAFLYILDEPTSVRVIDVFPSISRVGEPYAVRIDVQTSQGIPTGTVRLSDGDNSCEFELTVPLDGEHACELVSAHAGKRDIDVSFESDSGFEDSTNRFPHTTIAADTASELDAFPAAVAVAQSVQLRARVTAVAPGGGIPGGAITFFDGDGELCSDVAVDANGQALCDAVFGSAGAHALRVEYAGTPDYNASQAILALNVGATADLSMSFGTVGPVSTQSAFELQVDVVNDGPSDAAEVVVELEPPADTPLQSFSGAGWACNAGLPVRCTHAALAVGAAPTLRLQFTSPVDDGSLPFAATVSSSAADFSTTNNSDSIAVAIDGPPVVSSMNPATGSTEGGYPMQIGGSNFGTAEGSVSIAASVCAVSSWSRTQIVCVVPAGVGAASIEVQQASTVDRSATFDGFVYNAPRITMLSPRIGDPAGGYVMQVDGFDFGASGAQVTIGGAACGDVSHDADQPHRRLTCMVPPGDGTDLPVVVIQSDQSTDGAMRFSYAAVTSDLLIAKASTRTEVFARGIDEWTLLISNLGPDAATGARVVDTLPAHLTAVSWSCAAFAGASCSQPEGTGDIDVSVDLPAGTSVLFTVTARIPGAPLVDVVNTASIVAPAGSADPAPANNTDTESDPMSTVFFDAFESP